MIIGLVIVTYNSAPHVARALRSVAGQTRRPDRVLVIDNASTDTTIDEISRAQSETGLNVQVIRFSRNCGFASANNVAVSELADCELIALLNPDVFPEPGWLHALARDAAARPEFGSFASRLMLADRAGHLDGAGDVYHVSGLVWRHGHGQPLAAVPDALTSHPVFSPCAGAALYRRADWVAVGGFDERFFCYLEDVDLGFRLQLVGRPCWYVADAVAHHVGSASSTANSDFAVYHGHRNLEWVYLKNMPAHHYWRYLPLHLLMCTAGLVLTTWQGRGRAFLRAKLHALAGMPEFARARRLRSSVLPLVDVGPLLDRSSLLMKLRRARTRHTIGV